MNGFPCDIISYYNYKSVWPLYPFNHMERLAITYFLLNTAEWGSYTV